MPVSDDAEDDVALLGRAAGDDRAAFAFVVTRHQASLYRFVRTLTPDLSRAEDALQDAFLAAWKAAGTLRGDGAAVRTWLFTIARHAVERQFRRRVAEPSPTDHASLDTLGLDAGWGREWNPEEAVYPPGRGRPSRARSMS